MRLGHLVTFEEYDQTTTLGVYSSDVRARDAIRRYVLQEKMGDYPILPGDDENLGGGAYFNIAVYTINGDEFWTPERELIDGA